MDLLSFYTGLALWELRDCFHKVVYKCVNEGVVTCVCRARCGLR